MKLSAISFAVLLGLGLAVSACSDDKPATTSTTANNSPTTQAQSDTDSTANKSAAVRNEPISPIEVATVSSPEIVELGKKMFFDPRLSKSGAISCNSCHNLALGGTDNLPTSIGHNWAQGPINSPTVLNSKFGLAQFWDGRAKDLAEQAGGPIVNPLEMASTNEHVLLVLNSIPAYQQMFNKAYNTTGDITIEQVTDSLAQFEETLVTPDSRFDKWLKGDDSAITAQELEGYELFKSSGCVACHNGAAVGGASFQKFGLLEQYTTKNLSKGRFGVTGKAEDELVFKVPTLRNIDLTYPYFHDGAVNSLEEAVRIMGKIQLGREFNDGEIDSIVAFLKTLTGEQPQIGFPQLPPSNANTPLPQPFKK
ncbi:MAG: cytochrome-c peroxidase [Moraxella sp.]|nr:cytochrome-c peroxidase [Moraxella sp.]